MGTTNSKENEYAMIQRHQLIVAAIDFGTTYSGYAFSFHHEFEQNPLKMSTTVYNSGTLTTHKAPTSVLIEPDGKTLKAFGYDAENEYHELSHEKQHKDCYYFEHFKMKLYRKKEISRKTKLKDFSGKKLAAKTVFALAIKYLRDHLMKESSKSVGEAITDRDIRWVLTVPAIWNDSAKQFMREAAEEAGIPPNQLTICLEPEGASLFCQYSKMELCQGKDENSLDIFKPGTKYLLIDAGGGTVDITVHEVMPNGELRELHQATGGDWGGKKVNDAFEIMLQNIVGKEVLSKFKDQNMADYIDLLRDFELKKRKMSLGDNSNIYLRVPLALSELVKQMTSKSLSECIEGSTYKQKLAVIGDKVKINTDLMKSFFDESITNILNHVDLLLADQRVSACKIIVMVGGYSESPLLQARAYERFHDRKVIIPREAGLAIMKGAIIYGNKPKSITERVCKYTYGHDTSHISSSSCNHLKGKQTKDINGDMRCYDIFSVHARINQTVKFGVEENELIVTPICDNQTSISLDIFSSTSRNPYLVTEPECKKIGTLDIPIPDISLGRKRRFGVSFIFGGTEIEVKVVDKASGKIHRTSVDYLG